MKRIVVLIGIILILSACGMEKQSATQMLPDCVNSIESNGEYKLAIIANRNIIEDKEAFAKQLIEQVRTNDFKTIYFSYDLSGYPTSLDMMVYLNEDEWDKGNSVMEISLRQENWKDGYNIVDDLEKFKLEID